MQINTDLNFPPPPNSTEPYHIPVKVTELDWGLEHPLSPELPSDVDMILAADCVYFEVCFVGA